MMEKKNILLHFGNNRINLSALFHCKKMRKLPSNILIYCKSTVKLLTIRKDMLCQMNIKTALFKISLRSLVILVSSLQRGI